MSEHDDRMRRLLEAEPTTSCEKWAAAKIKSLEAELEIARGFHDVAVSERNLAHHQLTQLEAQLEDCTRDNHQLERDKDELRRQLASARNGVTI